MFRTAIPFGYMFIAFFLFAVFIAGVALFVRGWRRHSLRAKSFGAVLCIFVVIAVVADLAFDSALEWNPEIDNDIQVAGVWTGSGQTVTLAPDHTFIFQAAGTSAHGTWTRNDWNLYLRGDSYSAGMRFVQFRGRYRLMTHPPDDPDAWDGDLGLRLAEH